MSKITSLLILAALTLYAKDKHSNQDEITVDARLSITDGPITRFVATRHYDRLYVYAERATGKPVTLIDVTNSAKPRVLSDSSVPAPSGTLLAVAGTAALAGDSAAPAPTNQTLRFIDFSNPTAPKVTRQFDHVTAVENVTANVILLANPDGIWILSRHLAEDPGVEERYARKVVYGESMY